MSIRSPESVEQWLAEIDDTLCNIAAILSDIRDDRRAERVERQESLARRNEQIETMLARHKETSDKLFPPGQFPGL